MYFTWEDSLNTGIEAIDLQHRKIVDYINALHQAVSLKDYSHVSEVMDMLIDYTVSHFSFEESLMRQYGYAHADAHSKVHASFTNRILHYKSEWDDGKDITRKLLNDLKVWLISHIQCEDAEYVKVVEKKVDQGWVSKVIKAFFD